MYNNVNFDKEYMKKWDKKTESNRTWENSTDYFEDITYDIKTYHSDIGGTSNLSQWKSVANIREENQEEVYLRELFDKLTKSARADKKHVHNISNTNCSMVSTSNKLQDNMVEKYEQLPEKEKQLEKINHQIALWTNTNVVLM